MWAAGTRGVAHRCLRMQRHLSCCAFTSLRWQTTLLADRRRHKGAACPHAWSRDRTTQATPTAALSDTAQPRAPLTGNELVLGIETSCDDTAAAVVRADGTILGLACASQATLHAPYGGVVPRLAAGAHASSIRDVIATALHSAGVSSPATQLAAVAVTTGPGLAMCLRVGVCQARHVASSCGLPVLHVHHMEAHALVARLTSGGLTGSLQFPFVALLVSGGHNMCVLAAGVGKYTVLGATLDDALGEAFDKTARLLGLDVGAGGGPALEALATRGTASTFRFARPLTSPNSEHRDTCEFSFAGLKTAARIAIARELGLPADATPADVSAAASTAMQEVPGADQTRADIAACFQATAVAHVAERTRRALAWARELEPRCDALVVAGGVARNQALRHALGEVCASEGMRLVCPPQELCTDNGVMVAWAGVERLALGLVDEPVVKATDAAGVPWDDLDAAFVDDIKPRWPLGDRHPATLDALKRTRSLRKVRLEAPLTGASNN